MKRLIATHNSATGERPLGLLSYLVYPFAKCQSKTIKEQFEAGCRYFDIRIRPDSSGVWYCYHGFYKANKTAEEAFSELDALALQSKDKVYVLITYEGKCSDDVAFIEKVYEYLNKYAFLTYVAIYVKKPVSRLLKYNNYVSVNLKSDYIVLDGRSWHTYIPIPWLWKKIYYDKPTYIENCYTMSDFL